MSYLSSQSYGIIYSGDWFTAQWNHSLIPCRSYLLTAVSTCQCMHTGVNWHSTKIINGSLVVKFNEIQRPMYTVGNVLTVLLCKHEGEVNLNAKNRRLACSSRNYTKAPNFLLWFQTLHMGLYYIYILHFRIKLLNGFNKHL